ncbi:MAG: hypothetical protein ACJ8KA_14550, partial [Sulfurifustis sp.]
MVIRRKHEQLWRTVASGLLIPNGTSSQLNQSSSQTYLEIKTHAQAIEELYATSVVTLPATCYLARLVADAKTLSDSWFLNQSDESSATVLFRAGHLGRIAEAVLPLSNVADRATYLAALTSGSLDLLARDQSRAKDVLWEIELWSILRRRSIDAELKEPPDIVAHFEDSTIGIACKKLYSEKHVQNVLSQGVAQIESSFDFGILAINIVDLIPENQILRVTTQLAMSRYLNDLNVRFLHRHDRHFRKYLKSGRVLSALILTSVLADVY